MTVYTLCQQVVPVPATILWTAFPDAIISSIIGVAPNLHSGPPKCSQTFPLKHGHACMEDKLGKAEEELHKHGEKKDLKLPNSNLFDIVIWMDASATTFPCSTSTVRIFLHPMHNKPLMLFFDWSLVLKKKREGRGSSVYLVYVLTPISEPLRDSKSIAPFRWIIFFAKLFSFTSSWEYFSLAL